MKLLFKHIFRSIIKSPWQSIVILACSVISAAIFGCIPGLYNGIETEREFAFAQKYGSSSVYVTPSSGSYVTLSELDGKLPNDVDITGFFAFPFAYENENLLGSAADLKTVSDIFEIYLTEDVTLPENKLGEAVLVTSAFASEKGLNVGDELKIKVFSLEMSYTVAGISEYTFFGEYEILAHAPSAVDSLAAVSPVFAVFDGNNLPYSKIFIKGDAAEIMNSLSGCDVNAQLSVGDGIYYDKIVQILLIFVLFLSVILSGILLGFSLEILGRRRSAEMKLFRVTGVTERMTFTAFCIEIFAYILISSVIGAFISGLILQKMSPIFDFAHPAFSLSSLAVLSAALGIVGVISILVYKFLLLPSQEIKRSSQKKLWISFILFILLTLGALFLKFEFRIPLIISAGFAWVFSVIFGVAPLCRGISRLLSLRAFRIPPELDLAAKNNSKLPELHNICRVLCITASICTVLLSAVGFYGKRINNATEFLNCDYIVIGADEDGADKAKNVEGTERAEAAFISEAVFSDGRTLIIVDASDALVGIEKSPKYGIILSKSMADFYGITIGDSVVFEISGKKYSLLLEDYASDGTVLVRANVSDIGLSDNVLLISANGDSSYSERLSEEFSMLGAALVDADTVVAPKIHFISISYEAMSSYISFLILLAVIGSFNLACVSYIRRKKQLAALHTLGMTYISVALTVLFEIIIMGITVFVLSALSGRLLTALLDSGMRAFGYNF